MVLLQQKDLGVLEQAFHKNLGPVCSAHACLHARTTIPRIASFWVLSLHLRGRYRTVIPETTPFLTLQIH
jgi:hypothetical protein